MASIARRRSWIVVLAIAGGLLGAVLVNSLQPATYTAGTTLLVTTDDPFGATRLAQTYADALPDDGGLLRAASDAVGSDEQDVRDSLDVEAETETAVMRVEYRAGSEQEALLGATAAVEAITGDKPAATSIPADIIEVIRAPRITSSPSPGVSTTALAVGAILGLFLGVVLAVGRERSDRRVDRPEDLALALSGVPATRLTQRGGALTPALLARWRELSQTPAPRVAVVSSRGLDADALESLVKRAFDRSATLLPEADAVMRTPWGRLESSAVGDAAHGHRAGRGRVGRRRGADPVGGGAGPGAHRVVGEPVSRAEGSDVILIVGGPLDTDGSAELIAQSADLTVIAVRRGTRERDVQADLVTLEQFGVKASWGLLAG